MNAPLIGNRTAKPKGAGATMVVVKNLNLEVTEAEITDFFKEMEFNAIRARLLYDNEGNSKGFGFVELGSQKEVDEAVKTINGEMFQGKKLTVQEKN